MPGTAPAEDPETEGLVLRARAFAETARDAGRVHADGHQARSLMLAKRRMPGKSRRRGDSRLPQLPIGPGKSRRATLLSTTRRAVGFPILRRPDTDLQNIRQRTNRLPKRKSATHPDVAGGHVENDHARSQGYRRRLRLAG